MGEFVLRKATKKGHKLFNEKSAPQRKSWLRLCFQCLCFRQSQRRAFRVAIVGVV